MNKLGSKLGTVLDDGYILMIVTQMGGTPPFGDLVILAPGLTTEFVGKVFAKMVSKADVWLMMGEHLADPASPAAI